MTQSRALVFEYANSRARWRQSFRAPCVGYAP